ncbi:MAG: NAD(P)-dependent oxidoreductase [Acidobacteria bacterium]|nr:NAD(P)-dependent oxidoreductase [Acidobacteriota bacterium]
MKRFDRVLITGSGGMLGNAIYPYFLKRCATVMATDKVLTESWLSELDVRDETRVRQLVTEFRPDLILHLAAETDLEFCETHADVADEVNSVSTRRIAELARDQGSTLVYISTAGVFDGGKSECYTEDDPARPIMVYGQSKFDGEEHVRAVGGACYVVRAGWMVGGGPAKDHKFVSKILQQIADGRRVLHAVDDRWGTPTYTHDFANNLFRLLDTERYGTYHMVCEGSGTRYDVAQEIVTACGRDDIGIERVGSDYFAAEYFAPRPRSEMLVNANLERLGVNLMRPWRAALREYIHAEYRHLLSGAAADERWNRVERRGQGERRQSDEPHAGAERRQLMDRRALRITR